MILLFYYTYEVYLGSLKRITSFNLKKLMEIEKSIILQNISVKLTQRYAKKYNVLHYINS